MDADDVLHTLDLAQAMAMAQTQQPRFLLYESAGIFWIGAEILILSAVLIGRRRMESGPPFAGRLRPGEKRIVAIGALVTALLAVLVLGRHYVLLQPYDQLASGVANVQMAADLYKLRLLQHLALWAVFVVLWVVLEGVIVYQGWRGFRHLRRLLVPPAGKPLAGGGGAVLLMAAVAGLLLAHGAQASPVAALESVQAEALPYYNALYLLLRIAGAAWVAIEWVAAGILLRSFLLLRGTMDAGQ